MSGLIQTSRCEGRTSEDEKRGGTSDVKTLVSDSGGCKADDGSWNYKLIF